MKTLKFYDNYFYVTDKNFNFQLDDYGDNAYCDDDTEHQFGILFEILNMHEATGEEQYKHAPFIVSAVIMADNPSKDFSEEPEDKDISKCGLLYDTYRYMGGVPIDHFLINSINGGLEQIKENFSLKEAILVKEKQCFGTYAAQHGTGQEFEYLQFKTKDAAKKLIDILIKTRVDAISMMIGFLLDNPINLMGDDGWSVVNHQVKGHK